jgi:para-aminobenzoate synthetase component 1
MRRELGSLNLSRAEFEELVRRGYDQVPLIQRRPLGDLAPRDLVRVVDGPERMLLESTRAGEEPGRYSIVGANVIERLTAKGDSFTRNGVTSHGNPMQELRKMMAGYRGYRPPGAPLFVGGGIGYFSYECNRYFERLPAARRDDVEVPDIYVVVCDRAFVIDHATNELLLLASGNDYDNCMRGLAQLAELAQQAESAARAKRERTPALPATADFASNFEREEYERAVTRVKEYIRSGDVYQVNLSQRLSVPFHGDSFALYDTLGELSPVHFASYLELDGFEVACASPERLVRLEGQRVYTRPIAGTRRRGSQEEDARFIQELRTDEKEVSEHAMLVDLERNDLGRVCSYGSVRVSKLMDIVKYAHVIHIESEVEGALAAGKDFVDVIEAMFPGGTITGMPKVRTMQIIAELEPTCRALYTGSIGYLSFTGEMDLNIVIRTILIKDGAAYVNVGGGVVWDSVPAREYKETLNKARSQLSALASQGDPPCYS